MGSGFGPETAIGYFRVILITYVELSCINCLDNANFSAPNLDALGREITQN